MPYSHVSDSIVISWDLYVISIIAVYNIENLKQQIINYNIIIFFTILDNKILDNKKNLCVVNDIMIKCDK